MSRSVIIAVVLVVALVLWVGSGYLLRRDEPAPVAERVQRDTLVEARSLSARPVTRFLLTQGDVRPNREVLLRAEVAGQFKEVLVEKGARVAAGAVIARLDLEALNARRNEVQAQVTQREADYKAASSLGERGFAPETRIRESFAQLQAARAALARVEQDIENTTILAPFAGIVNTLPVEVGQFIAANGEVGTLIDNDPLIVSVNVPQQSIDQVKTGERATVSFVTGRVAEGVITYVSANAQRETRTFRVDVRTTNPQGQTPSGISAEVRIPVETVAAHFLSPALLSLGPDGALGVKTVGPDDVVQFHKVDIVRAQADGIFVAGLPQQIRLITTGQGFVQPGQRVAVTAAEPAETAAPVSSPPPPREPALETAPAQEVTSSANPSAKAAAQPATPPRAAPAAPAPTAKAASEPADVAETQRALAAAGFEPGEADGVIGPQTAEAIRAAQKRLDLPVTGAPTQRLLKELRGLATAEAAP